MNTVVKLIVMAWAFLAVLAVSGPAGAYSIGAPEVTQEQSEWCWAAVSKSILEYYLYDVEQCEIAEYTRTHATFHDFGDINCCEDASQGCNYWNYLTCSTGDGCIVDIFSHWGLSAYGVEAILSLNDIAAQIAAFKPFIVRWGWLWGGGHFVVVHGVYADNIDIMDPRYGEGYKTVKYDWLKSDGLHDWTHTGLLSSDPGCRCDTDDACCDGCLPINDGGACDDGVACSYDDACSSGTCAGTAYQCDDEKKCTVNICVGEGTCLYPVATGYCLIDGECLSDGASGGQCLKCMSTWDRDGWTYLGGQACDDGDLCTHTDVCAVGGEDNDDCGGTAYLCDDGLDCTIDACSGTGGCRVDGVEDGYCLIDGECVTEGIAFGQCLACVPGFASWAWTYVQGVACDDGDACTTGDVCRTGYDGDDGCRGSDVGACDDENPCTDDGCDAETGCFHYANEAPCDDGNVCTFTRCVDGTCEVINTVVGCCNSHDDCGEPGQVCLSSQHLCVSAVCRVCAIDADCGGGENRCVDLPSGRRCLVSCEGDEHNADCDDGYECLDHSGEFLCLPVNGDCECVATDQTTCVGGKVVAVDSCGEPGAVIEDCGGRGCLDGTCCPDGTVLAGDQCVDAVPDDGGGDDLMGGDDVVGDAYASIEDQSGVVEVTTDVIEADDRGPQGSDATEELPTEVTGDAYAADLPVETGSSSGGGCTADGVPNSGALMVVLLGLLGWVAVRRRGMGV